MRLSTLNCKIIINRATLEHYKANMQPSNNQHHRTRWLSPNIFYFFDQYQ